MVPVLTGLALVSCRDAQVEQDGDIPNRAHLKLGSEDPHEDKSTIWKAVYNKGNRGD